MVLFFLPGGRAMIVTPVSSRSSPVSSKYALPPPKTFGKSACKSAIDLIKGIFEAVAGFLVDLADHVFEGVQRFDQIVVLRVQITFTLGLLLVFVDGRQVDRTQALNARGNAFEFFLGVLLVGLGRQRGEHAVQVVAVFQQLILQGLAPHGQGLPFHALLFQLAANQLRLLLGLVAAFFGVAQFAVGVFQGDLRGLEFFVDGHALVEQLFELQAQLFQRCFALLQVEAQLFAFFGQAFGLHFQALQGLTRGIVLGLERAQAHRQLMGMILVLAGFLAHPIEAFAQAVALGQQQLALLGVQGHGVEGFLQLQARFADVFVFQRSLFCQLGQFFIAGGCGARSTCSTLALPADNCAFNSPC